jgi:hypothetical protein
MHIVITLGFFQSLTKIMQFSIFIQFQNYVERYFNHKIKFVQSDWGGEFPSISNFFEKCGIAHRVSCPYTHKQNGAIEHKHRHLVETGLPLLYHANVPLQFWDDAFQTACYLINRLPTPILSHQSPFEKLFQSSPDYSLLKIFGSACWPNLRPYNSNKPQPRSLQCVFLGYSLCHKGYKCFHVPTSRVYISRDVIFQKNIFSFHMSSPSLSHSTNSDSTYILGPPPAYLQLVQPTARSNNSMTQAASTHAPSPNNSPHIPI